MLKTPMENLELGSPYEQKKGLILPVFQKPKKNATWLGRVTRRLDQTSLRHQKQVSRNR